MNYWGKAFVLQILVERVVGVLREFIGADRGRARGFTRNGNWRAAIGTGLPRLFADILILVLKTHRKCLLLRKKLSLKIFLKLNLNGRNLKRCILLYGGRLEWLHWRLKFWLRKLDLLRFFARGTDTCNVFLT
jgi:hypothetical protein